MLSLACSCRWSNKPSCLNRHQAANAVRSCCDCNPSDGEERLQKDNQQWELRFPKRSYLLVCMPKIQNSMKNAVHAFFPMQKDSASFGNPLDLEQVDQLLQDIETASPPNPLAKSPASFLFEQSHFGTPANKATRACSKSCQTASWRPSNQRATECNIDMVSTLWKRFQNTGHMTNCWDVREASQTLSNNPLELPQHCHAVKDWDDSDGFSKKKANLSIIKVTPLGQPKTPSCWIPSKDYQKRPGAMSGWSWRTESRLRAQYRWISMIHLQKLEQKQVGYVRI